MSTFARTEKEIKKMSDKEFQALVSATVEVQQQDVRENQLRYYKPASPQCKAIHFLTEQTVGIGGGNGSSKTETSLVELVMCATGIFPDDLKEELGEEVIRNKCRGPMKCRIIVKSLKNQLEAIMLKKLKWFEWTGLLPVGGSKGHWGWLPRTSLIDGSWDKSWIAGRTTLNFYCRDPYTDKILGVSNIQFMSSDQEALAMAGNDLQFVLMDEPSTLAIWRENQSRVMRGQGRIFLAMTWPDDPSIPVDWIFDEIYDMAEKDETVEWVELRTYDNPHLDQDSVVAMAGKLSEDLRKIRYEGKPMRFSNLIHPLFSDRTMHWCFDCGKEVEIVATTPPICGMCKGFRITTYNHVEMFDVHPEWPTIFLLDPHPRKPHMWSWVQVDPQDDLWQIAEGELDQEPSKVAEVVQRVEAEMCLNIAQRLMDPNMGAQVCGKRREVTWQDEFQANGLPCELAIDSGVGRQVINERLKPDVDTYQPRIHIHSRCTQTIFQMKRYVWDEHRLNAEKDLKQVPKTKNDDYPTLLKYCVNSQPVFRGLTPGGGGVISTRVHRGQRR